MPSRPRRRFQGASRSTMAARSSLSWTEVLSRDGGLGCLMGAYVTGGDLRAPPVAGRLKDSRDHAFLFGVWRSGLHLGGGISHETFSAAHCLTGREPLHLRGARPPNFRKIIFDLQGYEGWLGLRGIRYRATKRRTAALYRNPARRRYRLSSGSAELHVSLRRPVGGRRLRSVELFERADLLWTFSPVLGLDELRYRFANFEDLLILLSDHELRLNWPTVTKRRRGDPSFIASAIRSQEVTNWKPGGCVCPFRQRQSTWVLICKIG